MTLLRPRATNGSIHPSLNDEIAAAESEAEIAQLLLKGESFARVSNRTKNRWQRTARYRVSELKEAR